MSLSGSSNSEDSGSLVGILEEFRLRVHDEFAEHPNKAGMLLVEIVEGNLPRRFGYEWTSSQVTYHFSKYR